MEGVIQGFLGVSPLQNDSLSWSYAFCSLDCQKVVQKTHMLTGELCRS